MRDVLDKAGHGLLSARRWKERLLLWLAGAAIGVVAVAFARLADLAQVGFCLIAWATQRYFPGAEGSGIPQTIHALGPEGEADAPRLMRARIVIARIFLAAAGLFCGGSIGR